MARGPLFQDDYRPLFSGHETFPLRNGWLKKAYDSVATERGNPNNKNIFLNDSAIGRFGVGKNMVASIRHWATCTGVIEEDVVSGRLSPTDFGDLLFGPTGFDPYLENPASLWLLHWRLCSAEASRPIKTTFYWVFSHFSGVDFRREDLVGGLMKLAEGRKWPRVSRTTVQRDVECFVRTYEATQTGARGSVEDSLECPLSELGLVRGIKGNFHLVRGAKPSLTPGVFALALNNFWIQQETTRTLSFEKFVYEPGSPGRVFLLDEPALADHLFALEDVTNGAFRWSETAGLKQVIRERVLADSEVIHLLERDYRSTHHKGAIG